jgi:hypothetical protein
MDFSLAEAYLYRDEFYVPGFGLGLIYAVSFSLIGLAAFHLVYVRKGRLFVLLLMLAWCVTFFAALQKSNIARGALAGAIGFIIVNACAGTRSPGLGEWFRKNFYSRVVPLSIVLCALVYHIVFGQYMSVYRYDGDYRHLWKRGLVNTPEWMVPLVRPMTYMAVPLPAFDFYLNYRAYQPTLGQYSLRPVLIYVYRAVGREWDLPYDEKIGFSNEASSVVYGFFYPAHRDFGLPGILVLSLAYGWLSGFYFRKTYREKRLAYLGPYCCIGMILLSFGDLHPCFSTLARIQ